MQDLQDGVGGKGLTSLSWVSCLSMFEFLLGCLKREESLVYFVMGYQCFEKYCRLASLFNDLENNT